ADRHRADARIPRGRDAAECPRPRARRGARAARGAATVLAVAPAMTPALLVVTVLLVILVIVIGAIAAGAARRRKRLSQIQWFAAVPVKASPRKYRTLMLFFSESDAGQFLTTSRGAPELGLARPPTTHRQFVAWSEGVSRALERHRSLVESVAGAGGSIRRVA